MKVLFLSHTHAHGAFAVGSHHLSRALARQGHDVAHLSPPLSRLHHLLGRVDERLSAPSRSVDADGVFHAHSLSLLPARPGLAYGGLKRDLEDIGFQKPDVVLVDQPKLLPAWRPFRESVVVYRPTDRYAWTLTAFAQRMAAHQFVAVVATSDEVLAALPRRFSSLPTLVLPNGVWVTEFVTARTLAQDRSGIVYVGAMDDRFDWGAVLAIAESAPRLNLTLAGPASEAPRILPRNVRLKGPIPYSSLPRFLARFSVGLVPLNEHPANRGRSPMKLYEYIAAGLNVVARSTPPIETAASKFSGILTYRNSKDAPSSVMDALAMGVPELDSHVLDQDWSAKAERLLSFLSGVSKIRESR